MNNRQKAKHSKMLYEKSIRKVTAPRFPSVKGKIVRVAAKQTISDDAFNELSAEVESPLSIAGKCLYMELAKEISKYAIFTYKPSEIPYHVDLFAEINVISLQQEEK